YVFIGPILPMDVKALGDRLKGLADRVVIDKLNYPSKVRKIYQDYKIGYALSGDYFRETTRALEKIAGVPA
ncbi:MAG: radical SAM protein, partial [Nitrospirota bacterium]|nr:radical SAM protein [Nitrospirota bacterium]